MFYTGEYIVQGMGSGGLQRRRSRSQDMGAEDSRTWKRPRFSPKDTGMARTQDNSHSRTTELGGNPNRLEAQPVSVTSFVSGPYSSQSFKSGSSSSQIGRSAHRATRTRGLRCEICDKTLSHTDSYARHPRSASHQDIVHGKKAPEVKLGRPTKDEQRKKRGREGRQ